MTQSPGEETEYVGYFAIPERHCDELALLDQRLSQSLADNDDEFLVRANDVYRRALAVSVYRRVFAGEEAEDSELAVFRFMRRGMKWKKDQSMFSAREVRAMAPEVRAWERKLGGEDSIVARIHKRDRWNPTAAIQELYRAFKEVLDHAAEHGAAVVLANLSEGAEERLAAKRAEEERYRNAPPEPIPPEERPPWWVDSDDPADHQAAMDAWAEQHNAKYRSRPIYSPRSTDCGTITLALVPIHQAAPIHKFVRQASRHFAKHKDLGHTLETDKQVRARVLARAQSTTDLPRLGEVVSMNIILTSAAIYGAPIPDERDFTLKQSRRLLHVLRAWEARVGMGAVLDEVLEFVGRLHAGPRERFRPLCAHAFRTLVTVLAQAVDQRCSMFWLSR